MNSVKNVIGIMHQALDRVRPNQSSALKAKKGKEKEEANETEDDKSSMVFSRRRGRTMRHERKMGEKKRAKRPELSQKDGNIARIHKQMMRQERDLNYLIHHLNCNRQY